MGNTIFSAPLVLFVFCHLSSCRLNQNCYLKTTPLFPFFSDYLFNNNRIDGDQRYDRILEDIEPLMEEGYSFYVTGHRYVKFRSLLFCAFMLFFLFIYTFSLQRIIFKFNNHNYIVSAVLLQPCFRSNSLAPGLKEIGFQDHLHALRMLLHFPDQVAIGPHLR